MMPRPTCTTNSATTVATYFATARMDGVSCKALKGSRAGGVTVSSSSLFRKARHQMIAPSADNKRMTLTIDQMIFADDGLLFTRGSCGQLLVYVMLAFGLSVTAAQLVQKKNVVSFSRRAASGTTTSCIAYASRNS